jgi:hypothetical protein
MADRETVGARGVTARVDGDDPERDRLDEQEDESFPASDPHSDWAGGPPEGESE